MMNSIQQYVLNNWESIGINGPKPKKLFSMQLSMGQGKRYDKGRLIHLLFGDNKSKPFIVAKFSRSVEYEYHLKHENEICNILREKYRLVYPPKQIHQAVIEGKQVNFEEFIEGHSFKISLDNFACSPNYSPEDLQKIIEKHFEQASQIITHLNSHAENIDKTHIDRELDALIEHFKEYYTDDKEFTEIIDKEAINIFETLSQEAYHRIVNFDFIPQNVIYNNKVVRVVDWEFSDFSTLLFLEPLRFLYYYVWELTNLKILKENDFEKIFTYLVKSDDEEWFINLVRDFYSKNCPYKISLENGFLIFLIFEADLQLRTTNNLEPTKKYYRNLITKFVNSASSPGVNCIEFKSGYGKRIEILRKLTDKDARITEITNALQSRDARITELASAVQSRDARITELNSAMQSRDAQITELNSAVQSRDVQITELNSAMQSRDAQITELTSTLQSRDAQVAQFSSALQAKDAQFSELTSAVQAKDAQITELTSAVQVKDARITELDSALNAIHQSISWRLVMKYQKVLEWLLPQGTRRRRSYDLGIKGLKIIVNEGYKQTIWRFKEYRRTHKEIKTADNNKKLEISKSSNNKEENHIDEQYILDLYNRAGQKSPEYVPVSQKHINLTEEDIKLIAFYLPQYHPIPENDKWWGKGFTDWKNVSKAVPQFNGHYQPRLPDELGFYDLRNLEVLKRQIELAQQYGIYGFCFHYYWFNGKKLLEKPLNQFLSHPELNFRFCICWANENWTRRWDGMENEILIAQTHSVENDIAFIKDLEPFFRDPRYIRINGKPVLIVYRLGLLPDAKKTAERWREYCIQRGIGDIYLIAAQTFGFFSDPRSHGFDAAVEFPPHTINCTNITRKLKVLNPKFSGNIFDFEEFVKSKIYLKIPPYMLFKTVTPGWDNTARRPDNASIFHGSTPEIYKKWLSNVVKFTRKIHVRGERIVFINAWNEWAEGAYLEPDMKYGYGYLQATSEVVRDYRNEK